MVFAGTMKDISSRSITKKHISVVTAPVERYVASDVQYDNEVSFMRISMNQAYRINAKWEIIKIIDANEVVKFDKLNVQEDAKKNIIVPFKLISETEVMVNNDRGLIYNVSMLSSFGTIAIYKKIGLGYEIIEAKMVKEVQKKEKAIVEKAQELVLERALNSSKSTKVLTGSDAIGEMILSKDKIEDLRITLSNTNGEVQNVDIASIKLLDGGSFNTEIDGEEVSGVIFANGSNGYRLNFVSGPLAGAMLNFMTYAQMESQENKNNESNDNNYDQEEKLADNKQDELPAPVQEEVVLDEVEPSYEASALEERRMMNEELLAQEGIIVLTPEEIKEITENQGYAF